MCVSYRIVAMGRDNLFEESGKCLESHGTAVVDVDFVAVVAGDVGGDDGGWCVALVRRVKTTSRSRGRPTTSVCHCRTTRPSSLSVR